MKRQKLMLNREQMFFYLGNILIPEDVFLIIMEYVPHNLQTLDTIGVTNSQWHQALLKTWSTIRLKNACLDKIPVEVLNSVNKITFIGDFSDNEYQFIFKNVEFKLKTLKYCNYVFGINYNGIQFGSKCIRWNNVETIKFDILTSEWMGENEKLILTDFYPNLKNVINAPNKLIVSKTHMLESIRFCNYQHSTEKFVCETVSNYYSKNLVKKVILCGILQSTLIDVIITHFADSLEFLEFYVENEVQLMSPSQENKIEKLPNFKGVIVNYRQLMSYSPIRFNIKTYPKLTKEINCKIVTVIDTNIMVQNCLKFISFCLLQKNIEKITITINDLHIPIVDHKKRNVITVVLYNNRKMVKKRYIGIEDCLAYKMYCSLISS